MPATMKAVIWSGKPYSVTVEKSPKPRILDPLDVIVRLTTSGICGSDLHIYHGLLGSREPPWILGHEGIGIVTEIGQGVTGLRKGDRVVVSATPSCGHCDQCTKTLTTFCQTINPPNEGAVFRVGPDYGQHLGGARIKPSLMRDHLSIPGSLPDYLRVPFAETTCVVLPAGTAYELDYLLISAIWPTAWFALDCANFQAGDSVAVFGAGPVGLLCAYSAILRGASAVYSVDHVLARLEKAKSIGAIPINFTKGDPVTQILKHEPFGVVRSCDCVGFECVDERLKPREGEVVNNCIRVTADAGGIGLIGVYLPNAGKTPGAPKATAKDNNVEFPIAEFWAKGLSMQGGIAEVRRYHTTLIELIERGKATPSFVISREIGIEDAPDGYRRFSEHKETKVVLRFPWQEKEVKANGHRTKRMKYNLGNGEEGVKE